MHNIISHIYIYICICRISRVVSLKLIHFMRLRVCVSFYSFILSASPSNDNISLHCAGARRTDKEPVTAFDLLK